MFSTRIVALTAALFLTAGCLPELTSVEVIADTTPPLESSIGPDAITLTRGTAAAFTLVATNADGEEVDVSAFASGSVFVRQRETTDGVVPNAYVILGDNVEDGYLLVSGSDTSGEIEVPYSVVAP